MQSGKASHPVTASLLEGIPRPPACRPDRRGGMEGSWGTVRVGQTGISCQGLSLGSATQGQGRQPSPGVKQRK